MTDGTDRRWAVPALALSGAFVVLGVGMTVEMFRGAEDSGVGDVRLLAAVVASAYWLGVGSLVLGLAWFAHGGSRWARLGLGLVGTIGCGAALYWLSYEQYGIEGLAVVGSTALLCAVTAVTSLVRSAVSRSRSR